MILYKVMKQEDFEGVKALLNEAQIALTPYMANLHNATVLVIDGQIKGFSTYKMIDNDLASHQILYISESVRNRQYGDGLIKALLNTAEERGIYRLYTSNAAGPIDFFEHVGFEGVKEDDPITGLVLSKDPNLTHFAQLPEFFDTACKSKR